MRRIGVSLLVATALVLPGCSVEAQPGQVPSPGSSSPHLSSPPAPASSAGRSSPAAAGVLVQFDRQGGIAGLSDQLTVRRDGSFTLVRKRPPLTRSGQLSQTDLAELTRVLAGANLATLPKVEPAQGADLFTYQVIYDETEILAMDGGMVDALKPVVGLLSGIVNRYGG